MNLSGEITLGSNVRILNSQISGISKSTDADRPLKPDNARVFSEIVNLEGVSEIVNSTVNLNQKDGSLSRKHAGKILNAENLKVLMYLKLCNAFKFE